MSRFWAAVTLLIIGTASAFGQAPATGAAPPAAPQSNQSSQTAAPTELTVRSRLVLVPTLVATKTGAPVFTLTADDFVVTDDGVKQTAHLEADTGGTPLALAVVIQTGGEGAAELDKYRGLGTLVEAMASAVPHRVAVIGFDSKPKLMQDFTDDLDAVGQAVETLRPGNQGAAIFDGLGMAIDMLAKEPETYRREILLISETADQGSQRNVDEALRTISDTNTTIYSLGFHSTAKQARHEAGKIYRDDDAGPPGGCMSRDANSDGGAQKSKAAQAYDCAGLLLPPLRLAKIAEEAARNGLRQNVPRTVAEVSGGEYFEFKNVRSFESDLVTISNHMPNRYLLSFQPQSPHAGMHALEVKLPDYPQLRVAGRRGYWVDADEASSH